MSATNTDAAGKLEEPQSLQDHRTALARPGVCARNIICANFSAHTREKSIAKKQPAKFLDEFEVFSFQCSAKKNGRPSFVLKTEH